MNRESKVMCVDATRNVAFAFKRSGEVLELSI